MKRKKFLSVFHLRSSSPSAVSPSFFRLLRSLAALLTFLFPLLVAAALIAYTASRPDDPPEIPADAQHVPSSP